MKGSGRQQRAQTLIVVLILLFLGTIISTGLMRMWETEVRTNAISDDGRLAFYLAQAAVERGKAGLKNSWSYGGNTTPVNMSGGNYTVQVTGSGTSKTVIGTGRVREAMRQLQVNITGTLSGCTDNCDPDYQRCGRHRQHCGQRCRRVGWHWGHCTWTWTFHIPCDWDFSWPPWIIAENCILTISIPSNWCVDIECRDRHCCWMEPGNCTNTTGCTPTVTGVNVTPETWGVP
jgi:hypothetical protein